MLNLTVQIGSNKQQRPMILPKKPSSIISRLKKLNGYLECEI